MEGLIQMIVRHSLPTHSYTKIDRHVFTSRDLTDGAKVLYGYLAGLKNGASFSDKYVLKALNISQSVLTRRKKELKDAGLILMDQVSPRVYVLYIGHTGMAAGLVRQHWRFEDDH